MSSDELDTIWNRNAVVLESVEQCIHDLITSKAQQIPGKSEIFTWNGELPQNLYEWQRSITSYITVNLKFFEDFPPTAFFSV